MNFTCPLATLVPATAAEASARLTPSHPSSPSLLPPPNFQHSRTGEDVPLRVLLQVPPGCHCLRPALRCEFHEGKSHVLGSTTTLAPSPENEQGIVTRLCTKAGSHPMPGPVSRTKSH